MEALLALRRKGALMRSMGARGQGALPPTRHPGQALEEGAEPGPSIPSLYHLDAGVTGTAIEGWTAESVTCPSDYLQYADRLA